MEEWGRSQISSQASKYVTILDLRERWLKENERKHKEKEDLRQLGLGERQQKVPRTEHEKKDDQKPVVRKPRRNASSWSRNGSEKFRRYYRAVAVSNPRNVNETCKKIEDESEPELAVPRIERDKKKEKKGRKKNPRVQKGKMDKTSPTPEENLKEEFWEKDCEVGLQNGKKNVRARKIDEKKDKTLPTPVENLKEEFREKECEDGVQNGKKNVRARKIDEKKDKTSPTPEENLKEEFREKECEDGVQNGKKNVRARKIDETKDKTSPTPEENLKEEFQEKECEVGVQNGKKNVGARKIDEKKGTRSQRGPEKTGYAHEMKEMENKLSLISVSFEIKRGRNNGVDRGSSQGNRNFRDHRGPRKQRDVKMIWVRKDELSKGA